MRKELDVILVKQYPYIFKDRHASMMHTAMCWGFECGDGWYNILDRACKLIDNHIRYKRNDRVYVLLRNRALERYNKYNDDKYLIWFAKYQMGKVNQAFIDKWLEHEIERVRKHNIVSVPEKIHKVVAIQVKEKYGTLRFYVYGGDDYTEGIVAMAEAMSSVTCEICGDVGKERNERGWYSTRCDKCFNKTQSEGA